MHPLAFCFLQDQLVVGATAAPLPARHRLLYVRSGSVSVDGEPLAAGNGRYASSEAVLAGSAPWSELWRWELAPVDVDVPLLDGDGVLSRSCLSRIVVTLDGASSQRIFRLDVVTAPAGRVVDLHTHPGPGIRCMLEGTFNVEQAPESRRDLFPGDAWWETGVDPVIAWGAPRLATTFVRAMLLPGDWLGKRSGKRLREDAATPSKRGTWTLLVDQSIGLQAP